MRFKKSPQLPGARRTRAWHYHGSHKPTSPGAIKMACQPKHFGRQRINNGSPHYLHYSEFFGRPGKQYGTIEQKKNES